MSREIQLTFDAADPIALASFWAEALGYVIQPPPGREMAPGQDPIAAWMEFLEEVGGVSGQDRRESHNCGIWCSPDRRNRRESHNCGIPAPEAQRRE